jgi:hypothetical protein
MLLSGIENVTTSWKLRRISNYDNTRFADIYDHEIRSNHKILRLVFCQLIPPSPHTKENYMA